MLTYSRKPQIIRLNNLQEKERTKFISEFQHSLTEMLPNSLCHKFKSSQLLASMMKAIPDIYYTLVTIYFCRRRLGQEYTYVAMYKQKHYQEQGVLINKKTRLLFCVMELITRNMFLPAFSNTFKGEGHGAVGSAAPSTKNTYIEKVKQLISKWLQLVQIYLGDASDIISKVQWGVLMVFMLDWNKHFTFLQTIFGIRYAYTLKNDQIKDVSYAIQGYLLLFTFVVKAVKGIYQIVKIKINNKQQNQFIKQSISRDASKKEEPPQSLSFSKQKVLCRICYDSITCKSSTKCGHIFCWDCIIRTLQISPECPVCRGSCHPREVVQLRNY